MVKIYGMKVAFDKEYLLEIYTMGRCVDKKHRYQPNVVRKYIDVVNLMKRLPNVLEL